jgi:hypothetical protein
MGTETTLPLRHDCTHAKMVQELERLNGFSKVEFLGTDQGRTALYQTVSVSKFVTDATNGNGVVSFSNTDGVVNNDKVTIEGTEYKVTNVNVLAVTLDPVFAGSTQAGKTEQTGQRIFTNKIVTDGTVLEPVDLTTAVAETNGDKLGDTVIIPAVYAQIF